MKKIITFICSLTFSNLLFAFNSDIVEISGGTPKARIEEAFKRIGGVTSFIKTGQRVVIKPNIGWARLSDSATNTNPEIIEALVNEVKKASPKKIIVFDHSCSSSRMAYDMSGIKKAAEKAGADVLYADKEKDYTEIEIKNANSLKKTKIFTELKNADVFINVPVVKVHSGAELSLSMKNLMGAIYDRGTFHMNDLQQSIADLSLAIKPNLILLDATRVLLSNGPAGPGEVKTLNTLIVAKDPVAGDAYAAKLIGYDAKKNKHIKIASEMKIGRIDIENLKIEKVILK